MEHFFAIKLAHVSFALISISFFVLRVIWSLFESAIVRARWVRILPHINDTLLLAAGLYLMVVSQQYPPQHPWLAVKLIAVVVYILLGSLALRGNRPPLQRGLFALLAVAVFGYIIAVAATRSALPFG